MNGYLALAISAARRAALILMDYYDKKIDISYKSSHYDWVTSADIESEKTIVSFLKEQFPEHNILAEENKYPQSDSEYTWVIDPLDGTINFAHSIPQFCISIALVKKTTIQLGLVYDPVKDELFCAEKGKGANLNRQKIKVSKTDSLYNALLTTGFYYDRDEQMIKTLENIKKFFKAGIVGIRRFGSAALDLCNVACGRGDGFWEFSLSPWDFAAGKLIVEEAGGKISNNKGKTVPLKPSFIVASNRKIHDEMLKLLK